MNAREYSDRLHDLLRAERHAMADFLIALADFDARRLWMDLGYASLFAFLHEHLRLSRGATYYRLTAAQLLQRYPEIADALRDGRLCITSVIELAKVITPENRAEVLPRFFDLSKREAKEVAAELRPADVVPQRTVVTSIAPPLLALAIRDDGQIVQPANHPDANFAAPPQEVRSPAPAPAPRTVVEPKTATLTRLSVTVSRSFPKKLAAARDALSHKLPFATDGEILEAALDLVLAQWAKRRGIGAKPRAKTPEKASAAPPPSTRRSRHLPADVWRAVWARDRGCCAWPLETGGVCGETRQLELDHVKGWALGAGTTVDECRLLCRPHQDVSARRLYGDDVMNNYTRPKGGGCSEPVAEYGASRPALRPAVPRLPVRPTSSRIPRAAPHWPESLVAFIQGHASHGITRGRPCRKGTPLSASGLAYRANRAKGGLHRRERAGGATSTDSTTRRASSPGQAGIPPRRQPTTGVPTQASFDVIAGYAGTSVGNVELEHHGSARLGADSRRRAPDPAS